MENPDGYDEIMKKGWPAEKVVVGLVTNPANCKGWVGDKALRKTLSFLVKKYPGFGGVMGWEYFNSMTYTLWFTKPLPNNLRYSFALPAPKSDRHYGYPNGQDSDWTDLEVAVVDHRMTRPCTQPTREIEIKSEATDGTLYVAENQAATSGAHSVHSLLWLLSQADLSRTRSSTDSVVFTATVSQREAVFHVHWFSPKDNKVYMSYIDSFAFMKDLDIQGCRNLVKNILDYSLEVRQPIIRNALKLFHPIPKQWKRARPASVLTDVAKSFTSDNGRSSKSQKTELEIVFLSNG